MIEHVIVSVVTVCYNAETMIERTICSVLAQNFKDYEYLIIDGQSTDRTLNICHKYADKLSIYSEKDKGIFDAMNKGITKAKGEWIIFMNAGDVFYDGNVLQEIMSHNIPDDVGFIFGDTYIDRSSKMQMLPFVCNKHKLCSMGICHQSLFVRTRLARQYPFDLHYQVAADYNMVRQIYSNGWDFIYIPKPISIFDTTGYSSHNRIKQIDEVAKICNAESSVGHKLWKAKILIILYIKKIVKYMQ